MNIFSIFREFCRKNALFALITGFSFLFFAFLLLASPAALFIAYLNDIDINVLQNIGEEDLPSPSDIRFVLIVQAWYQILTWGIVGMIMMNILDDKMENISLKHLPILPIAILMILSAIPLAQYVGFDAESFRLPSFLQEVEKSLEASENRASLLIKALLSDKSPATLILNILVLAIVPGVCEEIFFRNFIQKRLSTQFSPCFAIFITSLIFSIVHFQIFGFFSRMILGAVLGYIFYISKSIVPSILAHFTYNATMLFGIYAANARNIDMEKEVHIPIWFVLISISLLYFLGKMAYQISLRNEK